MPENEASTEEGRAMVQVSRLIALFEQLDPNTPEGIYSLHNLFSEVNLNWVSVTCNQES